MKLLANIFLFTFYLTSYSQTIHYDTVSNSKNELVPYIQSTNQKEASFKGGNTKYYEYITSETNKYLIETGKKIEDKVYLRYLVSKFGTIDSVLITKASKYGKELDKAAYYIIKNMPAWEPALDKDNKPVESWINMIIPFK